MKYPHVSLVGCARRILFLAVVLSGLWACSTRGATEAVTITEFLASNSSGLLDEDGDASDWIEIGNAGPASVNLEGWFLTDSPANLTKWRFPSRTLAPASFAVVFASGKNRATAGAPLHANFQLSAAGEYLALVKPDGVSVASEFGIFPEQFPNVSYGIAQNLEVTLLVSNTSPVGVLVPTADIGQAWISNSFDASSWTAGTNGVGYQSFVAGFSVKNIRANIGVCDLAVAESVLATPSQQAAVFLANPPVINYLSTDNGAHFAGDVSFPGFTMGIDENNFVTEVTGIVTIPSSGNWTFGVNSDDGFSCSIGANTFSYPSPRGPGDSLATFNLAAGDYPVRLLFYECSGGAELEFFAASGVWSGFNATVFRLVGNTAGGGLAVKSLPASGASGDLRPLIATDVQAAMVNRSRSAYLRLPFAVSDTNAFSSLRLRVRYDDGFVAYLNGVEIARRNVPATVAWNSAAPSNRSTALAQAFEDIDVPAAAGLLVNGSNVLAIHGLNDAIGSGEFLQLAELGQYRVVGLTNHYFSTPSPGAVNGTGFFAFVDNLKFTPGRGWFDTTNFSVTITSATPGVSIRYTTNGSAPTATSGFMYTGAGIPIGGTTLLRAIGYRAGFEPTEVETHSYLFLNQVQAQSTNGNWVGGSSENYTLNPTITQGALYGPTFKSDLLSIPTLSIVMSWNDLFGPSGVWSNPQAEGVAWERPCSLEYMRPDGEKGFDVNCGIRIQGGASRNLVPKHGLRVLFKNAYAPGKLDYPLYPDSAVQEFDTLTLHAMFNDHWLWGGANAAMQRDQWCRDTQNAMGGFGPHGTYVHLYLNGLYWGLYNVGEKGDASYAAHHLGGEKEEYDALNSDEVIDGDATAWNTMFGIANGGINNDSSYTNLASYLNIPNFIDYLLLNFYAANTDWPGHNWNAARRRVPGAGFHFFSWDAEWTFGIGNDVNTDRTGLTDGSPGRLYTALRNHAEFRRLFGDHAQKRLFNGGALTPGPAQARWQKRAAEINRAVVPESARWGGSYTHQTWLNAEAGVLSWFPQRTGILVNQLRNAGLYPQLAAPLFLPFGGLVPPGFPLGVTNPNPAGAIYFTTDGADPRLWGGAVSSSARLYSGPIALTNALLLRARIRDGTNWSALIEAPFYVVQDFTGLRATEVMYHPPPFGAYPGDELEFLELKNTGTNTLDLSGLQFSDGLTFAFTNGTQMSPGAFFVLARNPTALAARYPGLKVHGLYSGRLDNGGERITLAHVLGTNVFSFTYNNAVPWPITADGYGFSLVPKGGINDLDLPTSWRPSTWAGGSPGQDDPEGNLAPVVINEILTHTDPPLLDGIELYNPTAATVDVSGWFLSDDSAQPRKFRFPSGSTILAGSYLVVDERQFNSQPGVFPSFALNSHGESLYLFSGDATTNLTGYSHSFDYGAAANGVSLGRWVISTGEEQWPAVSTTTFGSENSAPRLGPILINEIQYNPAPGYDEFVELWNISSAVVPLYDPTHPTNTWKLSGLGYSFSNNVSLPAGGHLLLVNIDPALFRSKYAVPASVPVLGPYPGALQNNGENLRLERPDTPDPNGVPYIVIDAVRYNDRAPWPTGADGDGPSLQRRGPGAYGNEPTNWFASGITPGTLNVFNQGPACVVTVPTNGAEFTLPATIALQASATDSDGSVVRVEFYAGERLIGLATNAPFSVIWSNVPPGTHTILAKARDNGLAVTSSEAVIITVHPPPLGNGLGLRADYFDNIDFTGSRVRRIDPVVNFDWGSGAPDPGIGPDSFSVRWLGQVQPRFSETYTFYVVADDGVRLWVNNQLLVDRWVDQGPTEYSGVLTVQAGVLYDIKMEMYENGGGAVARLLWASPNVGKEIIPSAQLYPPATSNLPPSVTLSSPVNGANFVATSIVPLIAEATDPDGTVFKVEFFNGTSKLGEDGSSPFSFAWNNVPAGVHVLRAVVTDDSGIVRTSAPVNITVAAGITRASTLIPTGATWRYLDNGSDQGSAWKDLGFVDSAWPSGLAQLGYGDGDEQTIVSFGPNSGAKHITTYFRRSFTVDDPASFSSLTLRLLRDDGAVVYLNGSEIYRNNMPAGAIGYQTPALGSVADETVFQGSAVNPGYLVPGLNVIAVEMHQSGGTSSDLSFDFELTGVQTYLAPQITTQPQSQTVAQGSPASLQVVATGAAPLWYQWRLGGTNLPGANSASLVFASMQPTNSGEYVCVVTNIAGSVTSVVATLTLSAEDTDGDGVPDAWELAHGTNPNSHDAAEDPDLDGLTNLEEFIAGTDAQDPSSYLRVESLEAAGATRWIQFTAVSNRTYSVLATESLTGAGWSRVTNVLSRTTNRVVNVPDTGGAGGGRFYRLVTPALP